MLHYINTTNFFLQKKEKKLISHIKSTFLKDFFLFSYKLGKLELKETLMLLVLWCKK